MRTVYRRVTLRKILTYINFCNSIGLLQTPQTEGTSHSPMTSNRAAQFLFSIQKDWEIWEAPTSVKTICFWFSLCVDNISIVNTYHRPGHFQNWTSQYVLQNVNQWNLTLGKNQVTFSYTGFASFIVRSIVKEISSASPSLCYLNRSLVSVLNFLYTLRFIHSKLCSWYIASY